MIAAIGTHKTQARGALQLFTALPACFRVIFAFSPIFVVCGVVCGVLPQHFIPPQHFAVCVLFILRHISADAPHAIQHTSNACELEIVR